MPNLPEMLDSLLQEAEKGLAALKSAAAGEGLRVETHVLTGQPAHTIVEHARTGGFDLIVMGTHGRTGFSHLFVGSVAERVVRRAPCPVLTVRDTTRRAEEAESPAGPSGRVGMPGRSVDGEAVEEARAAGARQVCLTASARRVRGVPRTDVGALPFSVVMPHLAASGATRCPVSAGEIIRRSECCAVRTRPGEHVVYVWRVADAVHLVQALGHGHLLAELVGPVEVVDVRGDQCAFGVVPRALSNSITRIHGWPTRICRHAQVGAPGVIARPFGLCERLTMCVGARESSEVAPASNAFAGDEEGRHRFLAAHFARFRYALLVGNRPTATEPAHSIASQITRFT